MLAAFNKSNVVITRFDNKKIYKLRNVNSNKYLNISNGYNYNQQNAFQKVNDNSEMAQEFRLIFDSAKNAYRIYSICSYNGRYRVLDIVKSNGAVANNCNVQIFTPTDDIAQYFKIEDAGNNRFKIVANSNTSCALAAYGASDGSDSGKNYNSAGNVLMQTYTGANNQLWYIDEFPNRREEYYAGLGFVYPLTSSSISSGYGWRKHPISGDKKFHYGIDIPANSGTALYAPFTGTVVRIGYESNPDNGRGHYIIIEATSKNVYGSSTKIRVIFMHMLEKPTDTNKNVFEGATVNSITQVGKVGRTGASTGDHLHLTMITDSSELGNSITTSNNPQMYYNDKTFSYQ